METDPTDRQDLHRAIRLTPLTAAGLALAVAVLIVAALALVFT